MAQQLSREWAQEFALARDADPAALKRKAPPSAQPGKKRKPAKVPKGASELFNKWQAVRKDLVRPLVKPRRQCNKGMDAIHGLLSREGASVCGLDAPQHDLLRVAGRRADLLLPASMSF